MVKCRECCPEDSNIYWGDIHRQTAWTCGEGMPADHFRTAKEHFRLDFAAVTDNARVENPKERLFPGEKLREHRHFRNGLEAHSITLEQWETAQAAVREHTKDGEFVAILGYEWCSARYGDHNVYYLDDEGPLYLPERLEDLYEGDGVRAERMIIPHHPGYARGRRGVNWNVHDPRCERLVEICSTQHGCSEGIDNQDHPLYSRSMGTLAPGSSVLSALDRGYKLGFTSGSDSHYLTQKSGVVGVFAPSLTRRDIFSGLWQRRTIASTGPKYAAWFTVDRYPIGSMVAMDYLPKISIHTQDEHWAKVQLIRNGEVIKTWENTDRVQTLEYQETAAGLRPDNYYYVRVELPDNEMLWMSPIWVSYLADTPFVQDTLYWLPEIDTYFWGRMLDGDRTVLKLHHTSRAKGNIADIQFEVVDGGERTVSLKTLPNTILSPGQSTYVEMPVSQTEGSELVYRVSYTDAHDNLHSIERRRILTAHEETVFPYET